MQKKIFFLPVKWWLILLVSGILVCSWVLIGLHSFLSQNNRVDAEVLVVEGWLPDYALDEAYREFISHSYKHIITTGGPVDRDFRMYTTGSLYIAVPDFISTVAAISTITIEAYGSEVDQIYPHFTVWVNDTICIGEAYADRRNKKFVFPMNPELPSINKVHLHYDNDGRDDKKDRDLFFRSLIINDYELDWLKVPAYYELISRDTKKVMYLKDRTMAARSASYLRKLGLTEQQVIPISAPEVHRHRTYTSALALKNWLETNDVKAINVFSLGAHSRRSRLSYEKVLDKDSIEVGVIAARHREYSPKTWWKHRKSIELVMREALKYTYIQFFFDIAETPDDEA